MLCRYLGCKLFMDSLSLAGIAVQNEEENVISDKIVIPILVILTLSKGRTVGDIEVFIEILAAGVTVFFQRVIIGYVMVSHYWSQRDRRAEDAPDRVDNALHFRNQPPDPPHGRENLHPAHRK